jgi:transcriptional regulator with XRE-family HTH domain
MFGGDLILMARRRAHLTQRELAQRIGCRQATIARWERGDRLASYEDVQNAAAACGLALDVHLTREDRSWWPQIAAQLDCEPAQRVRRLTPPGGFDAVPVLQALTDPRLPAIVLGEVAGALHGWPLVLDGDAVEICTKAGESGMGPLVAGFEAREIAEGVYELPSGGRLIVTEAPPGTSGFSDLARGTEPVEVDGGTVRVAGLLDLLRIADASSDSDARRHALAYGAVLDVQCAQRQTRPARELSSEERVEAWLTHQAPVA